MIKYINIIALFLYSTLVYSQVAITIPSEYEKSEKLLITWPYSGEIDSAVAEITSIAKDFADIDILFNPNNTIYDSTDIRDFLINMLANGPNIRFVPSITDTYWLRQYSPVTGYGVFADDLVRYFGNPEFDISGRLSDDSIPSQLANYYGFDLANYGLQFENTNIQYDGLRYLFVGDRIILDNIPMSENDIKFSLNAYFNSGEVMFIPTPGNCGGGNYNSIENYIKLLDPETLLITSIPDTLPAFVPVEEMVNQLASITNYFGKSFEIVRIPAAPNNNGKFPVNSDDEFRSYTNSLIFNNLVLIPSFGIPEKDSTAYNIYSSHLPGYEIRFVNATALTSEYGGIHTLTKEIPQPSYLRILHSKMIGIQEFYPEIKINTLCNTASQLENMWLHYKKNNDTVYTKEEIHLVCPQYFALIDKVSPSDTIHYYIEANSTETQVTYPLSAPEGNFTFWFDVVSDIEQITKQNDFNIFPNPSNGSFVIKNSNNVDENISLKVYNTTGQLINSLSSSTNEIIDLENVLKTGYYILQIETKTRSSTHRLIIQNR